MKFTSSIAGSVTLTLALVCICLLPTFGQAEMGSNPLLESDDPGTLERLTETPALIALDANEMTKVGQKAGPLDLVGSWDITIDINGKAAPSWLEVKLSGIRTLVGHFVGNDGSARPISIVEYKEGKFGFSIPPQWQDSDSDLVLEGELVDGGIRGTITYPDQKKYSFVGEKAPTLVRQKQPEWGKPINLFNGKDLAGWHGDKQENQWIVKDGILVNPKSGANLISDTKFEDFKLIVEFRYPEGSNSGIYLRGRYEVQIEDSKATYPASGLFGGVYGFLTPNELANKQPGEWQKFEITLIGRRVTVIANGKTIISDQIIPGITGGALDSQEGLPGPIMIQGDHGQIEFRKIELIPGKY